MACFCNPLSCKNFISVLKFVSSFASWLLLVSLTTILVREEQSFRNSRSINVKIKLAQSTQPYLIYLISDFQSDTIVSRAGLPCYWWAYSLENADNKVVLQWTCIQSTSLALTVATCNDPLLPKYQPELPYTDLIQSSIKWYHFIIHHLLTHSWANWIFSLITTHLMSHAHYHFQYTPKTPSAFSSKLV